MGASGLDHLGLLAAVFGSLVAAVLAGQVLAVRGFPVPEPSRRIGCVDGLRGYLALLVMMHHFDLWVQRARFGRVWGDSSLQLLHNFGPGGVALFFMTTGLVFYPRIVRGLSAVDWSATYISRVFRIVPLQAVMVAVALLLSAWIMRGEPAGSLLTDLGAAAVWLSSYAEPPLMGHSDAGVINAYVLWSLWYEWMFYLFVLPAMAWLRDRTRAHVPAFVLPVGLLVVGLIVGPFVRHPAVIFFLPLFAIGMIAFELRDHPVARRVLCHGATAVVSALLLVGAAVWLPGPYALPQLFAYALFFCCVAAGNSFGGLFALRGSIVLGEISFGLYLIHGAVLFVLFTFVLPADLPLGWVYAALPVAAVIAVLVSAAAHFGIERPGIAIGRRLSRAPRRPRSPAIEREVVNVAP